MRRGFSQTNARTGSLNLILFMLSALSCFYIGGRLYQDARFRRVVSKMRVGGTARPVEGEETQEDAVLRLSELRQYKQQLAMLENELISAEQQGYVRGGLLANATVRGEEPLLVVVGIFTGFGQRDRRDSIRNTWMPKGPAALARLQKQKGVAVRFVVGHSANEGDSLDRQIAEESKETKDFLVLDHVEGYDELPIKTQIYLQTAIRTWDAAYYFKVDDDVYINLDQLAAAVQPHVSKPRVYIGCMKSGDVFTDPNLKWNEPEHWKFGDKKNYFRHSAGQIYGLSKSMAHYVAINRPLLHRYRNEDVSVGAWMLGLDAEYVDDRQMCCNSPRPDCAVKKQKGNACVAVFDWQCSGLCESVKHMSAIHADCGTKPSWL